jgi:hypothetical protein
MTAFRIIRRWLPQPLRVLNADVGATCPDARCGEHGKPVQPICDPRGGLARDRCPTCLATVVAITGVAVQGAEHEASASEREQKS